MKKDAIRAKIAAEADAVALAFAAHWQGAKQPQAHAATWGRWSLALGETNPRTLGEATSRTPGILYLQIFIAEGTPSKAAYEAADALSARLRRAQLTWTAAGTAYSASFFEIDGPTQAGSGGQAFTAWNIAARFTVDTTPAP